MARTKISKIAKDLNVALPTVIEFLRKKDITVDDNPNARIEDDAVELLVKEFRNDKDLKTLSDQFSSERFKGKEKKAAQEQPKPEQHQEATTTYETMQRLKIVDKIELDDKGNPIVHKAAPAKEAPAPTEEASVTVPADPKPSTGKTVDTPQESAPAATETKPEPAATSEPKVQAEAKATEAHDHPVTAEKVETPVQNPTSVNSNNQVNETISQNNASETPEEQPVKETQQSQPESPTSDSKPAEDAIFTLKSENKAGPPLNIIGKIDLDSINQSTRPKKKTKEERRGERIAKAGQVATAADKKKRKRIGGKEKIDIEKTAAQSGNGKNPQQRQQAPGQQPQQGKPNGPRREKAPKGDAKGKRPVHTEVNEEDVQRQVKETLARLTSKDKAKKSGVKWRKEKREAIANREREAAEMEAAESRVLKLTEFVTANDLASMMDVPVTQVIGTCMNIGVMVSINQRLDAETINIVAEEFGFKTEYVSAEVSEAIANVEDSEEDLMSRPPIVTVMGHVDHGKTSLLDYIRNANVIAGEAGGITQHIGAYNVKLSDGRHITFLDTPGHEAFTAMRARGAKVTDLCIIIVAADDSVMPQTVEAINHASAAGVPIVFAINKIDKPHANPDKIKEELAAMNYLVEEWGGKYQSQDISAKKGLGVDELMEKVLLEAEMLDLKANPNRNATGSIIESSLDKGRGYVATVLVQNGTLRVGDIILAGTHFGKVKAMFNERNQRIKEAGPAEPALILGLNGAPTAGDTFNVLDTEQEAREIATKREQLQRELGLRTKKILTLEDIGRRRAIGNFQELNIIVKGDVDGSIEALSDSLIKLSTDEIQVNVLHKAVGEISESDVTLAAASDAIIIGFQVRPSQAARREAEREGVQIRLYSVIYQAIEEVKDAMSGMLAPEIKEEVVGTAEVLETYHISKVGTIAGAIVREGKIKRTCKVRLIRDGIVRYTGQLGSLKRFKDDVKEVLSGYDCGLSIQGYNDLKQGDIIEAFEEVEVERTL